jgi:hypothetical protein
MRSVPPRGSGWVRLHSCSMRLNSFPEPTRYRVVVLTSWDRSLNLGRAHDLFIFELNEGGLVILPAGSKGSSRQHDR